MIPECAIFRDRLINRSRVSKTTIFAPCAASPPSSSQLRATDQQQRREKKCDLLFQACSKMWTTTFFMDQFLGNRPSQSFISSLAPEKKRELLFETCWKMWTTRPRPAQNLRGWLRSTPRFPKTPWEIVQVHDFSLFSIDFHAKSMKHHGFPRFPNVSWEIWVSISTTHPRCVQA